MLGKKSKKGKVTTVKNLKGEYIVMTLEELELNKDCINVLETVVENGVLIKEVTLTEIRTRVDKQLAAITIGDR